MGPHCGPFYFEKCRADLAMFCDSLSVMGPPCGPFHLEKCRAPLWVSIKCHWLASTGNHPAGNYHTTGYDIGH